MDRRKALILGDGDGRFTARLLRANPQTQIEAIDASSAMLKELIRRAGNGRSRVHTESADIRNWQPSGERYDLIVSHFFLDCLTTHEIEELAEKMRRVSFPSSVWVISEFAIPQNAYGRWLARPVVAALYGAFGVLTGLASRQLPEHRTALSNSGLALRESRQYLGGLLVSELWTFTKP